MIKPSIAEARLAIIISMNDLVRQFIRAMPSRRSTDGKGRVIDGNAPYIDTLITASFVPDGDDHEDISKAIRRCIDAMLSYEYTVTADPDSIKGVRKLMEQLGSILAISTAYPEKAANRAKTLINTNGKGKRR
jgi:uncharacterized protein YqgV (UPF0045/DUF77 family)